MLVDVVSKNGTMLLSFPLMPDGTLDSREESILEDITRWMAINGEAIFATRPWKQHGEGPTVVPAGLMSERTRKPFTAEDIRFTTKNGRLFVFVMGRPPGDIDIRALSTASPLWPRKISHIRLLGTGEKLKWTLDPERPRIERPDHQPCDFAIVFELS